MSRLALYLLGPPRVELDGRLVHIGRRKALALLAYLVVTGPRPGAQGHRRDSLATLLWPEHDQSRARAELRRTLSVLRTTLGGEWFVTDRETIGLNPGASPWLDVERFHHLLHTWQGHGHPETELCPRCLSPLTEAVELYRGDFLTGFTLRDSRDFDDWQFFQTQGLRDELAGALERLAHAHSAQAEFDQAIDYARRWVALDPLHEPAHRQLMRLYAQAGQRAAALRQYGECERLLKEELGLPPERETAQLYQAIQEKREPPEPVDRAAPVSPPAPLRPHNLPAQVTPLVGREALLAGIAARLQDPACRLLTLVGPGGSGKTRLALEAATALVLPDLASSDLRSGDVLTATRPEEFTDGLYFVSLAPLESAEAIVPTVASALGFSFLPGAGGGAPGSPRQQLLDHLRQKNMLLILDNVEHLLAEHLPARPDRRPEADRTSGLEGPGPGDGAWLVSDILTAAPRVRILATSRARLNVQGEHLLPVGGLDLPDRDAVEDAARYGAVELFLQTARRVQPGFELTDDNLADVIDLCHRVEGMPLGILLAAAWVGVLTPAEIRAQVARSFDFLETGLRDLPERQRSMRAVFDHSWNLLTSRQRTVMKALSIFRGGFTRPAAAQVIGATLRELRALLDRSLLQREAGPKGRYQVHELLRQYALDKLGKAPAEYATVRDRHSSYYAHFLQQQEAHLLGWKPQLALADIETEIENVRLAWNWAVFRGRIEDLDRSLESLAEFYAARARFPEGEGILALAAQALSAAELETTAPRSRLLLGRVLSQQGRFCCLSGAVETGRALLLRSLAIFRDLDTPRQLAYTLCHLGHATPSSAEGEARYVEALSIFQELGDQRGMVMALAELGAIALHQGAYGASRRMYEERLRISREIGNRDGIASSLMMLGWLAWALGEVRQAEQLHQESLTLYTEIDHQVGIAMSLSVLGQDALLTESYGKARQLLQKSLAIFEEVGLPWGIAEALWGLAWVAVEMGEYAKALQLAQHSLAHCEMLADRSPAASTYTVLGTAARELGDLAGSRDYYGHALQTAAEMDALPSALHVLAEIAALVTAEGRGGRSLELLTLVLHHPASWQVTKDKAAARIAALKAELPPDVVAAARERGRARHLEPTLAELLEELEG
jgi:predicted ATPase/DNA-binding SARP family transcriptional activator